ncbi:MAG: hypothetical protein IT440_06465 [Phycisphaeraceae bacterium]|nr:hypothetical protein [Phycisphaeraceae bacterium]
MKSRTTDASSPSSSITDPQAEPEAPGPVKKRRTSIADRRQRVLELRKAGMSEPQIARILSLAPRTVRGDLKASLAPALDMRISDARSLDIERIDMALLAISKLVRKGDHQSIDRWIKLCELRRRLLMPSSAKRGAADKPNLLVKVVAGFDLEKV